MRPWIAGIIIISIWCVTLWVLQRSIHAVVDDEEVVEEKKEDRDTRFGRLE